jgi:ABC-type sugar transport system ATPase subunit
VALIQLQNVTVQLPGHVHGRPIEVKALDNVTLSVRNGEVMGVIGPTGCGKSTLLRVVAGLVKPTSGKVLFDGSDQRDVSARDRGVGMVFQDDALYPHWNVLDNLAFYFKLRKREPEVPERVEQAAEILGVDFGLLLGRMPKNLSVGQRQQVAIARCLVRDPQIFLMDEPFSNLDAVQRQHARVQLKRLLQRFRVTTVYVTHDQIEAAALCDRVAFMDEGHVWQVDTYRNLLAWPVSRRVAAFVADPGTEFVEGACLDNHFVCPAFEVPLEPAVRVRASPGQGLTLRVRPQAVSMVGETLGRTTVDAVVEWIEPLPLQRIQRLACRTGAIVLTVEVAQDDPWRVGYHMRLRIDPLQVQVFDAQSGANLSLGTAR